MEQKGEGEQREKRPKSVRQHFVLSPEMPSSSSSSSFYSSRRSRSALNADLPYLTLFDPPRYLIRPHVQLGAHVCEEPVPTPWCPIPPLDGFLHDNVSWLKNLAMVPKSRLVRESHLGYRELRHGSHSIDYGFVCLVMQEPQYGHQFKIHDNI